MQTITERFIELYNYILDNKIAKNAAEIARNLSVSPSAISNILAGASKAEIKIVQGVAKAYTAVNLHWLLNGSGEMILTKTSPEHSPEDVKKPDYEEEIKSLQINLRSINKVQKLTVDRLQGIENVLNQVLILLNNTPGKAAAEKKGSTLS